ncbi:MAG: hypothetical protein AAGA31_08700 [Bacteroidota bacterium]
MQRPPFTQQCGPFGKWNSVHEVQDFLSQLPPWIRPYRFPLSEGIGPLGIPGEFAEEKRTNYVLDLSPDFPTLQQNFQRALRRKLKKFGPVTLSPTEPDLIIQHYREQVGAKAGLKRWHYQRVNRLMEACQERDLGVLVRADEAEYGLLAAGFFPLHQGRLINLFATSTKAGYQRAGMARLLTALIEVYRGEGRILDFEGSDLPGVAEFFRSFGPKKRTYYTTGR